jgi:hypothetical protein
MGLILRYAGIGIRIRWDWDYEMLPILAIFIAETATLAIWAI